MKGVRFISSKPLAGDFMMRMIPNVKQRNKAIVIIPVT